MAQLAGKYELVENKNFYEFLLKVGIPEEAAKKADEAKSVLEVQVDGKKIRLISDSKLNQNVSELVLDEEVDEKTPIGKDLKSTATLDGSVLTIDSKPVDDTPGGIRTLTFSDTGLELKIVASKDDIPTTVRIYKRI